MKLQEHQCSSSVLLRGTYYEVNELSMCDHLLLHWKTGEGGLQRPAPSAVGSRRPPSPVQTDTCHL